VRRSVVRLITFVGGLYFLLEFLLPERAPAWLGGWKNPLTPWFGTATNVVIVVGTMAFLLGPFNLTRSHVMTLVRKQKGRVYSAAFLVALVVSMVATALKPEDLRTVWTVVYEALFYGVIAAFFASSMALLAFYLVSAAHRALRLSTADSALMLGAAAIILLGQVPAGDWLTCGLPRGLQLRSWSQWILMYPNTAVQRAVLIGACGGAFATGLRHWLGLGTRLE